MRLNTFLLAPLALLPLSACDDGAKPSDTPDTVADTADAPPTDLTGEIDGTWAMLETQTALAEVLGTAIEQRSQNYYRAVIADGKLTVSLCHWETADDIKLYTTLMRPALLAALAPFERDITVTANGDGFDVSTSEGVTTRGVNLDPIATAPMPTEKDDSRIFDQDADGNPGITIVLQGSIQGELYVIHRHKASLSGKLESDTRISGLTAWTTEQLILGASSEMLANQDPKPRTHPDATKSTFAMVKVDADDDCEALIEKRPTLFP